MEVATDPIWYNKISVLWERPTEFFPLNYSTISHERRINSMVRTTIAAALLSLILCRRMGTRILILAGIFLAATVFYYENQRSRVTTEAFTVPYNFTNMVQPKYVQPSVDKSRSLQDSIIDDIKNTQRFEERRNKDMKFFAHQLNREKVHFNFLENNKTPMGDIFTSPPYAQHMKAVNTMYL